MDALIRQLKEFYASLPTEGETRLELPPVATPEQVEWAERRLGFRLPELLRELYLEIGNGGWGTGALLLPNNNYRGQGFSLEDAVELYIDDFIFYAKLEAGDPWREKLEQRFPICDAGCQNILVLDCSTESGSVIQCDGSGFLADSAFELRALSLRNWLQNWFDGEAQKIKQYA